MRIAALGFSVLLMSGCSWIGGGQNAQQGYNQGHGAYGQPALRGSQYAQNTQRRGAPSSYQNANSRCQLTSPTQPLPPGCSPADVTFKLPQQSQSTPYGRSYNNASYNSAPKLRGRDAVKSKGKSRFRLTGGLGLDPYLSGNAVDGAALPFELTYPSGVPNPANFLDPANAFEVVNTGTVSSGSTTTTSYFVEYDPAQNEPRAVSPDISFSDIYDAPVEFNLGGEFALSPKTTFFADAGYTQAAGNTLSGSREIEGDIWVQEDTTEYDILTGTVIGTSTSLTEYPNYIVSQLDLDFSDMKRLDFEVGARRYFDPILEDTLGNAPKPYVSAAAGLAHYNELSVQARQSSLFYDDFVSNGLQTPVFFEQGAVTQETLLDEGWVPTLSVMLGAEWDVTDRFAIGVEGGVKYEGRRELTTQVSDGMGGLIDNTVRSDAAVTTPLMLRGRIGF